MRTKNHTLTAALIRRYADHLREQERSVATIQKYAHDLTALLEYLQGEALTKALMIGWKEALSADHAPATVNSMLVAVNGFLRFMGWHALTVRLLKIQRPLFREERRELSKAEYARLVDAAQRAGDERLALILQTICATGIRVSELRFISAEAVRSGRAEVCNKGKRRTVFLPDRLRRLLKAYLKKQKITAGAVFVTRTGRPLDRSNIWRSMKALCEQADIAPEKVFPHNLRHFFARVHYSMEKDLLRLADILGHSNINTTRIYTAESGFVYARRLEHMKLVIT